MTPENAGGAPPGRLGRHHHLRRPEPTTGYGRPAPRLTLTCELEELPAAQVIAASHEDELRIRTWLSRPAVRRRLHDALDDTLDALQLQDAA